jgi:hypothetical protein
VSGRWPRRGTVVLEAHLEGARGQLSDPHGVHTLRPAHSPTVRRARRQATGLSTGELARIWNGAVRQAVNESGAKCRIPAPIGFCGPEFGLVVRGRIELPTPRFSGEPSCPNRANTLESG